MVLHCGSQAGARGGGEADGETPGGEEAASEGRPGGAAAGKTVSSVEGLDPESSDEDMDHYLKFSRTVVVREAAKDGVAGSAPSPPASQSIAQLDGTNNGSESDASEGAGEESGKAKPPPPSSPAAVGQAANHNALSKTLVISVERIDAVPTQ